MINRNLNKMINRKLNGFFGYVLLSAVLLSGCGVDTPQFDGKKLFVVDKIESDTLCRYIAKDWTLDYRFSVNHPQIIAKKGMFQIGDTVCVGKHSK